MGKAVEIDSDVLEQLQMAYNLQKQLFDSDESRAEYESALKKKFPDKYKTSAEKAEPYLSPLQKKIEALEAKLKARDEKEQDESIDQTFSRLKKDNGYTDEGIAEIKKIMLDRKVADPEVAAAYFEKRNPPKAIESSGFSERGWNFDDDAKQEGSDAQSWFKDPNRMFDKIAAEEFGKKGKTA